MRTLAYIASTALACVLAAGCAPPGEPQGQDESSESDLAATSELSVKADGITLWLDPVAYPTERFGQPAWRLEGRASKNLERVFSFSSDDEFGEAIQTSARKFDVFVDAGQLEHLLAGYRLLLDVDAATGARRKYFASIRLAAKLERAHGTSRVVTRKTFTPFVFGEQVRFRNRVGLAEGWSSPVITTDEGVAPVAMAGAGREHLADWDGPALLAVAADRESEIHVDAQKGATHAVRSASVDIAVTSFQITTDMPLEHWPDPSCDDATLDCLRALPAGTEDRSSCGDAIEVRPCLWRLDEVVAASPQVFSGDLRRHLVGWYADHGADVAASGGNTLEQAQALVDVSKVSMIDDPEGDPEAHDLGRFVVFSHPDMVWPGSDIVWFGAYDRATGVVSSIYDFN
jgi:hypothetical protein